METFDHRERELEDGPRLEEPDADVEVDYDSPREVTTGSTEPDSEPDVGGPVKVKFTHIGWLYSPDRTKRWKGGTVAVLDAETYSTMKSSPYVEPVEDA